ncbi:Uncharacterised protein [Bordetella pertussis]|nr:Uncharacterised protein [Bordetella pertussis]CFW45718.1 Uncharacterised protein [Bordetella pertussis]
MRTLPRAMATRSVSVLWPTSTIRIWPDSSRWLRVGVVDMAQPLWIVKY